MAEISVFGVVDEEVRVKAEIVARRAGTSLDQLIAQFVTNLAESEIVSDEAIEQKSRERRQQAYETLIKIIESSPKGSPLDTMTDEELREEVYGDRI